MGDYDLQGEYEGSLLQNFESDDSKEDKPIQAQAENIYDSKYNTLCDNNGGRNTWNCFRREAAPCVIHVVHRQLYVHWRAIIVLCQIALRDCLEISVHVMSTVQ